MCDSLSLRQCSLSFRRDLDPEVLQASRRGEPVNSCHTPFLLGPQLLLAIDLYLKIGYNTVDEHQQYDPKRGGMVYEPTGAGSPNDQKLPVAS